jgi:hypothetical protein
MSKTVKLKRIHLGEGVLVTTDDVVGIFDIERTSENTDTKNYLRHLGKKAVTITYDMPKSFLVTADKTYISKLAPEILKRRFG